MTTNVRFEDWLDEQMQDPEFREAMEEPDPAYQVARLRMMRGLTQKELAQKVRTKQPSIARIESGKTEPRLSFLKRIAKALGARLVVRLVPEEKEVELVDRDRLAGTSLTAPTLTVSTFSMPLGATDRPQSRTLPLGKECRQGYSDISGAPDSEQIIAVPNWPRKKSASTTTPELHP